MTTATQFQTADLKDIGMVNGQLQCTHSGGVALEWCEHLERTIVAGEDHYLLHAGGRYVVPIFPANHIFVEVVIGEGQGKAGFGLMWMEFTPDIGRPFQVPLGFWNPGEGMQSIRLVIIDYLRSKLDSRETFEAGPIHTPCPAKSSHGMKIARRVNELASQDSGWKCVCLWNLVMEKACTLCLEVTAGADPLAGLGSL